jgi:hypothetical protein
VTVLQWAQLVALVAAAGFFLAKAAAGYFLVNMSVDASATRQSLTDERDAIAMTVHLTKGGNGGLRIHDTLATVSWVGGEIATALSGVSRLELQRVKGGGFQIRKPPRDNPGRPQYGLPPGDATAFSASVEVPRDAICTIDAVVIGRKWLNRWPGQWRTTIVSLPVRR